ncbi:MAG: hypothetical protein Q4D73_00090 [Actinomycetaceae bacterium]|nr:hypothetical protein [Actinomycetaceae bacterium]
MEHTREASQRQKTSKIDYYGVAIFFAFPLALHLMFNSVALLTEVGALGTPLASPTGHFSLLIATLLFATISYLRWHTELGLFIMIFWSGFWAAITLAASLFSWPELGQVMFISGMTPTLLSWSQLPLLFLLITIATSSNALTQEIRLSKRAVHFNLPERVRSTTSSLQLLNSNELIGVHTDSVNVENTRPSRRKRPLSSWQAFFLTVTLGLALLAVLFTLAPRSSAPLVTKEYELFLGISFLNAVALLVACLLVFTIAWLTVSYPLAGQLAVWLTLALPNLVVCPLWLTLSAVSATPHNPSLIAFSMLLPVAGSLGISISAFGAMHLAYAR